MRIGYVLLYGSEKETTFATAIFMHPEFGAREAAEIKQHGEFFPALSPPETKLRLRKGRSVKRPGRP